MNKKAAYPLAIALATLTLLVFAPVRNFQFVSWDDPLYVTENREVTGGLTWNGVRWAATAGQAANWHPVTWLSHMLDVELFGMEAGPHHLSSLVIHVFNSLLLFALLGRLTGEVGKSAFVAALFALHPQHVESVAWVSERKDVLSTMFGFLATHLYVSYVQHPRAIRYAFVVLAFALALMSKPMLVTLPFVLLLLDIWPLRRIQLGSASKQLWWRRIREKLPLLAMAVAISVVTVIVQTRGGTVSNLDAFPLDLRLMNIPVSYATYLWRTFWPAGLAPFYPLTQPALFMVILCILVLAGITIFVLHLAKRYPYMLAGWLWYLGTLAPVIGLIQAGDQSSADRYTYVPLLGIFFMVTWGLWDLLADWPLRKPVLGGAAIVAVGLLSFVARPQLQYWKDSLTLWSHTATVTRANYLAHTNLGFALEAAGRPDEALASFTEAVRTRPAFAESRNALGVALMNRGRLAEAEAQIREALRIKPEFGAARNNLGMLLARQGHSGSATVQFLEGLRNDPDNAVMRANLGMALAAQGRFDEAIAEYQKALVSTPESADIRNKLGSALYGQGKFTQALAEFEKALELQPGLAEARNNLGVMLNGQGRYDEAIVHLREAIRIEPQFAQAHNNLGIALSSKQQFDEAIANFQTALSLRPDYTDARQNLELAQAKRAAEKTR